MTLLTEPTRIVLAKGQPVPNDPNFAFNSLLLHGNGTNGSTTITDNSPSPKTVTAVGNAQISTAESKFGGASIAFDGNGDYLTVPHNSAFSANADFTVECWLRMAELNRLQFVVDKRSGTANNTEWFFYIGSDNKFTAALFNTTSTGGVYLNATSSSVLLINTWHHTAFTLAGTTLRLFIDGTLEATNSTPTGTYATNTNQLIIGRDVSTVPGRDLNGYIDDLRITKGVARYTSNFTPPTLPFPDF